LDKELSVKPKTTPEWLIYALPAGATERYQEELISSQCKTTADMLAVKSAASKDGWHSFRAVPFVFGITSANFAAAVAI
jgi:hypothetical protein